MSTNERNDDPVANWPMGRAFLPLIKSSGCTERIWSIIVCQGETAKKRERERLQQTLVHTDQAELLFGWLAMADRYGTALPHQTSICIDEKPME